MYSLNEDIFYVFFEIRSNWVEKLEILIFFCKILEIESTEIKKYKIWIKIREEMNERSLEINLNHEERENQN